MTMNRIALSLRKISYDQRRIDRIHLTAAIPLLAIKTLLITFNPSNRLTNSSGVGIASTSCEQRLGPDID